MQTVKEACTPRPNTFDPPLRDTVLDLTDLIDDRVDPAQYIAENYITEGRKTLFTEGFRRLEGTSEQGVFKLTQTMGSGKTHNLLALGLLAKHPDYQTGIMDNFDTSLLLILTTGVRTLWQPALSQARSKTTMFELRCGTMPEE